MDSESYKNSRIELSTLKNNVSELFINSLVPWLVKYVVLTSLNL